jgi:hypothetical protein
MSRIVSFRGLLADGGQDRIFLGTIRGQTGYKIVNFQIMSEEPYDKGSGEHICQVWSVEQTAASIDGTVDFSKPTLLGSAIINNSTAGYSQASVPVIVFDNIIFNQDIFVTHHDGQDALACNYHIELEQMDLALDEATVATLKNIRNND